MRKIIEHCPSCGGELIVTRMECQQCDTRLEGTFRATVFDRLSPESLAFVELFVRLKGNTKQMERELDVPYSTVRSRLDDVVRELGPEQSIPDEGVRTATSTDSRPRESRRGEILDRLDRGEITSEDAIAKLGGE
jgi:hypothetical protein